MSEAQLQLRGVDARFRNLRVGPAIPLIGPFCDQISQETVPCPDLESRDRRVPCRTRRAAADLIEAEMIAASSDVKARTQPITTFEHDGERSERHGVAGHAKQRD